ncbi:3-isopropylmalate dehydratase [Stella sp.]|uniref:LeuD/DmdB family oxidoreductase small subunit n=1 Tax=Stella sp. TaxID=2912054 RepID=UPI0035B2EB7B
MVQIYRGRCWKFGDNVLNDGHIMDIGQVKAKETDPAVLAKYCMIGLDPTFAGKAQPGDIVVAGRNFGSGQLHMQGPLALKGLGLAVVSESMTRSFYRLMITAGVPMLSFMPGITQMVTNGDELEVDFRAGTVTNLTRGTTKQGEPLAPFLLDIIEAGGELAWIKKQRAA